MMHGHEKSDLAIVAMKLANKAGETRAIERVSTWDDPEERTAPQRCAANPNAAESVERRAGTKGNADRQSTDWTQRQASVSQALERMRQTIAVWTRGGRSYGGAAEVVAPSSSTTTKVEIGSNAARLRLRSLTCGTGQPPSTRKALKKRRP